MEAVALFVSTAATAVRPPAAAATTARQTVKPSTNVFVAMRVGRQRVIWNFGVAEGTKRVRTIECRVADEDAFVRGLFRIGHLVQDARVTDLNVDAVLTCQGRKRLPDLLRRRRADRSEDWLLLLLNVVVLLVTVVVVVVMLMVLLLMMKM